MPSDIKWKLDPGQIVVNDILHVVGRDDLHVFEMDMSSKYVETCVSASGRSVSLYLLKGEHTLKTDDSYDTGTMFTVYLDNEDFLWVPFGEAPRYTARFILWKRPNSVDESTILYERKLESVED